MEWFSFLAMFVERETGRTEQAFGDAVTLGIIEYWIIPNTRKKRAKSLIFLTTRRPPLKNLLGLDYG
jgi:hypothetical protein